MDFAESTRLGVVGYLMLTMGVTLPKATEILKELETSGLVNVKTGGQLEIKVVEDNHETN
ncbi:hypothetical protein ACYKOU_10940 [Streptococcus suis]|uniref:hypothetical protein n=1 Tax=Streptococcus suis TaxID=1307 RepID=UPI000412A63B|nr:hypothetical protein [Streptococcus suis]ASW51065.1 hypothetical protein A7J09_02400 [Streptococcus suis]KPA62519.1 hypothetical protein XK26_10390 [Streptococcus suis]MBS8080529.1 hypothetical protein [Streptococcus suis]MCK3965034.1 hypothetical protein [Streptococcus suis]MCK3972935.1 hypothetical protein [Streptococcus suis]